MKVIYKDSREYISWQHNKTIRSLYIKFKGNIDMIDPSGSNRLVEDYSDNPKIEILSNNTNIYHRRIQLNINVLTVNNPMDIYNNPSEWEIITYIGPDKYFKRIDKN